MADIPQWAKERACELAMKDRCVLCLPTDRSAYLDAFAEYIADHEQPPVDHIALALVRCLQSFCPNDLRCYGEKAARIFRASLSRAGLTITASDATASVQSPERVDATSGRKG